MQYTHPYIRWIARRIPILCAIYFILFSFLYLFRLQSDLLAQLQYVLSAGSTVYHPLLAAALSTLFLAALGGFTARLLSWLPLRLKASAWFLPFLLLGVLTHCRFPQYGDVGHAPGWGVYVLLLLVYVLWLLFARQLADSSKENATFSTYLWPNVLLLLLFSTMSVTLSNTDAVLHHTLRSARQVANADYDAALRTASRERHPSRQLSASTALALSQTGQLGQCLFAYPQPHGSEGLLPALADTSLFCHLPTVVGRHLGYKKGDHLAATSFLQLVSAKPNCQPAVRDYLLCAHLLDKRLDRFVSQLRADSLAADSLPLHYREALLLHARLHPSPDTLLHDAALQHSLLQFDSLRNADGTKAERELRCRERFGATYWTYFYFN